MKRWVVGLVALTASPALAAAIEVRSGSWGYEYPGTYAIRHDGQTITLTGRRKFKFEGVIGSYWLGIYNCQTIPNYCPVGEYKANWYTGDPYGSTDVKGVGLVGTVTLSGETYRVGLPGGPQFHAFVYGPNATLPPLGADGKHVTQTLRRTFVGKFWHGNTVDWFTGVALVTVEWEQDDGKWEVESVNYDVVPQ